MALLFTIRPHAGLVLREELRRTIDSYSTFRENDRATPTSLTRYQRERSIKRIFLAGLPLDFSVRYSAEDAVRLGFAVVDDACSGVDIAGSVAATWSSFAALDVITIAAGEIAGPAV